MKSNPVRSRLVAGLVREAIHAGLGLGLICISFGAIAAVAGVPGVGAVPVILGLGIAVGWGVTFLVLRLTVSRPLTRITAATEALASQDTVALADMLAAVAEGDLTNRLETQVRSVAMDPVWAAEVRHLGHVVNEIAARLADGAEQLNSVTDEACLRQFYVGPDGYLQGQTCADLMGRSVGGQGQLIILSTNLRNTGLQVRRRGFEALLREKYPDVEVAEIFECSTDLETLRAQTASLLKKYPRLAGIYSTGCETGSALAVANAGLAGRITMICHDITDDVMHYVAKGVISATIGQDP